MANKLTLTRPLVIFDLETTGLNIEQDRIIEIYGIRLMPDGSEERFGTRINPNIPIPAEATAIHGICDADVATAPSFAEICPQWLEFVAGADLGGFNVERFDLPMLRFECARAGHAFPVQAAKVIDMRRIFFQEEPRDLAAASRFYCNKEIDAAHSAQGDTEACVAVLHGQLRKYAHLPSELDALAAKIEAPSCAPAPDASGKLKWENGAAVLAFGKHQGKSLQELAADFPDYLGWIARSNFPSDLQSMVRAALAGEFPKAPSDPSHTPLG